MTDAGRSLGQTLQAAREGKRWDLARAERETRIRARYLAALEAGDYHDLPDPVYTRGFVRNYARYLGLDPEWCLDLYRLETHPAERPSRAPTPPPTARTSPVEPRGTTLITTSRLVRLGLLLLVLALVAYVAYQFLTFAGTPALTVIDPPADLAAYESTSYVVRGETEPNAELTVSGLPENPAVTASATGTFSFRADLVPGSNLITLVATDPVTGRSSSPVMRTITVVLPLETPVPSGGPSGSPLPSPSP
jgi:cytoskeletal protein RodZ